MVSVDMRLGVVLLFSVCSVCAHNWINNPSRAGEISTQKPCPPRETDLQQKHLQVNSGAKIPIEWSTGHLSWGSWVLVAASDVRLLNDYSNSVFEEYMANAPIEKTQRFPTYHVIDDADGAKAYLDAVTDKDLECGAKQGTNLFSKASDRKTAYNRPDVFRQLHNGNKEHGYLQYDDALPEACRSTLYAAYDSPTYPYIKAASGYSIPMHYPHDGDISEFEIPLGLPSGKYILKWLWRGYTDCVDIDIVVPEKPVTDVWGTAGQSKSSMIRTDHCQWWPRWPDADSKDDTRASFEADYAEEQKKTQVLVEQKAAAGEIAAQREIEAVAKYRLIYRATPICKVLPEKTTDFTACGETCRTTNGGNGWTCTVANVVPLSYNEKVIFKEPNIPEYCKPAAEAAGYKGFMCFSGREGNPNDGGAAADLAPSDPEDPVFYSTCLKRLKSAARTFTGHTCGTPCELNPQDYGPEWRYGQECISCADQQAIAGMSTKEGLPTWTIATTCENCQPERAPPPVPPPPVFPAPGTPPPPCCGPPPPPAPAPKKCGTWCADLEKHPEPWTGSGGRFKCDWDDCNGCPECPSDCATSLAGSPSEEEKVGAPECKNLEETLAIRCCSYNSWQKPTSDTYGCVTGNFSVAKETCSKHQLRLCSVAEIGAGKVKGTGCDFNSQRIWSSEESTLPALKRCEQFCLTDKWAGTAKCTWKSGVCSACPECY